MFPQDPGSPFDDIRQLVATLPGPNEGAREAALARQEQLVKPPGALGRLEAIAAHLSAWQGNSMPTVNRPMVAVFAATHGVADLGVSPYPGEVTKQMMATFTAGKAAVNQICATFDAGLRVFDLALDYPTPDITTNAALDEKACAATMAFGMEAIAGGSDLLCLGDMGVGNSTVAAALLAALFGGEGRDWVGPGSGADEAAVARKGAIVDQALDLHGPHLDDPLEALARVGGREFAAIAGAILAARMERIPVLIDGFPATAAAAVLHKVKPGALDHCLLASLSPEPGHRRAAEFIGMEPVLDLGIGHGEGVGAALGAGLVKAAVQMASGMAVAQRA